MFKGHGPLLLSSVQTKGLVTINGTLYYLGRAAPPYTQSGTQGPDGSCDEYYTGAAWKQTSLAILADGSFLASGCYDPTLRLFFLFGNTDALVQSVAYDPIKNVQTQIGSLPATGGMEGCAAVWKQVAYIFGGSDNSGNPSSKVLSYVTTQPLNTSSTYTTLAATLPNAAIDPFCAVDPTTGLIYVGGGVNGYTSPPFSCFTQWQKFDPSNGTLTNLTALPVATNGSGCACLNGKIYVIGGSIGGSGSNSETVGTTGVHAYSIAGNSWTTLGAFPVPSALGRACVYKGVLYYACGWNASGFSLSSANANPSLYKYAPGSDAWSLHSTLNFGAPGGVLAGVDYPNSLLFSSD